MAITTTQQSQLLDHMDLPMPLQGQRYILFSATEFRFVERFLCIYAIIIITCFKMAGYIWPVLATSWK